MVKPNPQLEAALARFAAQPGATPVQEAQLRAGLIADTDELALFNQQAVGGELKDFASEASEGMPSLTGAHDKVADVIAVPVGGFQASAAALLLCSERFRRIASLLLATATVILASCATSHETLPLAIEAAAMTAADTSPATEIPALSAEEIGRRFLRLIEGSESREDLNLERVQKVLGVPLKRLDGTPEYLYSYSQPVGEGWYFSVDYISGSPSLLRGVRLAFGKPGERFPEFPDVACSMDFELYHTALVQMGFSADPYYDYDHGRERLLDWRYTKFKKIDGSVDMTISIVPQNIVAGEVGRVCIKSIGTLN